MSARRLGRTVTILSAFLLCGCITGISHRPPFNEYVGKPLKTYRTTILYADNAWENNAQMFFGPPKQALYLDAPPPANWDYRYKNRLATLPAGSTLRLLEVRQEVGDGIVEYVAVGEVYVPAWKRFVKFYHTWGASDKIWRAPWEPDTVPRSRQF